MDNDSIDYMQLNQLMAGDELYQSSLFYWDAKILEEFRKLRKGFEKELLVIETNVIQQLDGVIEQMGNGDYNATRDWPIYEDIIKQSRELMKLDPNEDLMSPSRFYISNVYYRNWKMLGWIINDIYESGHTRLYNGNLLPELKSITVELSKLRNRCWGPMDNENILPGFKLYLIEKGFPTCQL